MTPLKILTELQQREEDMGPIYYPTRLHFKVQGKPFDWNEVQIPAGMTKDSLVNEVIERQGECIFTA
ncbi:hypothetical protein [Neobacillus sp. Marseille-QA0830]